MTQQEALEILKMGHSVYLTGSAGSGKTFLLNQYIDYLKRKGKGVAITASTGIAATHMNGITIHSWSGLGVKEKISFEDLRKMKRRSYLKKRFARVGTLVIDEVSMLHSWQFDLIDQICRVFKENKSPFGGMQMVCSGDFFQLPPVSRGAVARFVVESNVWQRMNIKICYLEEQHRHQNDDLFKLLNFIRSGNPAEASELVERALVRSDLVSAPTKLFAHNIDVDRLNRQELEKLSGLEFSYEMQGSGAKPLVETLKKSCLAPEILTLKKGAKVMFVKNNFEQDYVNGTLGRVVGFSSYDNRPIVKTVKGKIIFVRPESWLVEELGMRKAEIKQLPLRLAWAITVHKSQGMTLDEAEIDLSKSFLEGMGYVALSRVRSVKGLLLRGINQTAFLVNQGVLALDKEFKSFSQMAVTELNNFTEEQKLERQKQFLDLLPDNPNQHQLKEKKKSTYELTKKLLEEKLSIKEIAQRRDMTVDTIIGHLEKVTEKWKDIDIGYLSPNVEDLEIIREAFSENEDWKLSPVKQELGDRFSFDELRLARVFLKYKI